MEAVTKDMPLPGGFVSPPNQAALKANIEAFERLLDHNLKTKIVWDHLGWDNTGDKTAALMRELLGKHTNLFMNIKLTSDSGLAVNRITNSNGTIKSEWLSLFVDFTDRFTMGIDHHYSLPIYSQEMMDASALTRDFLNRLPSYPENAIEYQNAVRIYNLSYR